MKRTNYASEWMIARVANLKRHGVTSFYCEATWIDSKGRERREMVTRKTAQGISSYANRAYLKHGDGISVAVYYFDEDLRFRTLTTYGA